MKKFLITGIDGFVGHYFVEYLQNNKIEASVYGVGLKESIDIDGVYYKKHDLTNREAVMSFISELKPDYIIHLAAISSVAKSWDDPAGCFLNNNAVFLNIADAIRLNNLHTRLLSVGSSEEYGVYDEKIKENFVLHPKSPYSVARLSQEYLSKLYVDRFGLDVVMTRSFNHIGPRQSTQFVVSSFIDQLVDIADGKTENKMMVGNIDVIRDFTDVRDVVDAYYKIVTQAKNREVYNVCSGCGVKLRDIIDIASQQLNIHPNIIIDKSRLRSNEIMSVIGDNTKLKQDLGWMPQYDLNKTISDIITYKRAR